jgi:hypothetical protein
MQFFSNYDRRILFSREPFKFIRAEGEAGTMIGKNHCGSAGNKLGSGTNFMRRRGRQKKRNEQPEGQLVSR